MFEVSREAIAAAQVQCQRRKWTGCDAISAGPPKTHGVTRHVHATFFMRGEIKNRCLGQSFRAAVTKRSDEGSCINAVFDAGCFRCEVVQLLRPAKRQSKFTEKIRAI
jgi:hypothetical protein